MLTALIALPIVGAAVIWLTPRERAPFIRQLALAFARGSGSGGPSCQASKLPTGTASAM